MFTIGKLNIVVNAFQIDIQIQFHFKICGNEQGDSEIYTEMLRAKSCPILRTKLKALYQHIIKAYFKVTLINIMILVQ